MKKTLSLLTVLLAAGIICAVSSTLQGAWVGNDLIKGDSENSILVEGYIIDGASSFLRSYSDLFLLLNESETGLKNGINLARVLEVTESALDKLDASVKSYESALAVIKSSTFNENWLDALKTFDYEKLTAARHLHPDVMNLVAGYLTNGDIVGLYQQLTDNLNRLAAQLRTMGTGTKKGLIPEMEALRTLYQQYSDSMLFGYYISLVFSEAKPL